MRVSFGALDRDTTISVSINICAGQHVDEFLVRTIAGVWDAPLRSRGASFIGEEGEHRRLRDGQIVLRANKEFELRVKVSTRFST